MQLYYQIRSDIVAGIYGTGDKLPSKRLLAEESKVSVITVLHAYSILCDEGYVESRERSGYFVIYKQSDFPFISEDVPAAKTQSLTTPHAKVDFPFSVLAKTMRRVLLDYESKILIKSPNHGCPELRLAISRYLARSTGITARPEQIIIGSGAEHLYSLIAMLLGADRVFALESPSYEKIRKVYSVCGVKYDLLKLGSDGIKSSELIKTDATVLHITPFNSYPSCITASISKRREYLSWAKERSGIIIEDNYDSELTVSTKNEDTVFELSEDGSVIYLNTFSRTVAPSFRIGYAVLPEKLLEDFEKKLGFYSCTVPTFMQYVLAELINNGDFERHINRVRRKIRKTV
jgi:GntR family transcriptional regulator/MocR family aminotransferase